MMAWPPLLHPMTWRTPRLWDSTIQSVFLFSLNASMVSETPSGETLLPSHAMSKEAIAW